MQKPRYRFNWKTGKPDLVYRFDCRVIEVGNIDPQTGMYHTYMRKNLNPRPLAVYCSISQHSDQMICSYCRRSWDVNDRYPPKCSQPLPG